MKKKLCSEYIT